MKNLEEALLPYQRCFINDNNRFKIWIAARQVGKSTAVAFEALVLAAKKPDTAILLVSASQRQSRELLERMRIWLKLLKTALTPGLVINESSLEVRLANQSRVISLPANPDTIRGFSGHIFLDEFAFHKDSQAIWAAVFPISTRGYKLAITSTPNGKQNMFYDIWTHGGDHWGRHQTSIYDAAADGLKVDIDQLRAGTPDAETWAQEYECKFVDEATAFLTYDLISAVESEEAGRLELAGAGPFYIGADIGRRRDLTVFWVLELVGDVLWTREVVEMQGASFAAQDKELDRLFRIYRPVRICMDQTGLGEKVVEDAKERYGPSRVEGLLFTAPVKMDLAMTVRRKFEDRQVRIPARRAIRDDLHSVQKTVTAAGNIRFDAARSDDGHADRFWSLALAVHGAAEPWAMPQVVSARTWGGVKAYAGY